MGEVGHRARGVLEASPPVVRVSVLIPSYGRPDPLRRCLASLRGQAYPSYEVVVADDASPQVDEYARIAEEYGVRLVRSPVNRGPAAARNLAVRHSTGDILIFLDDDCTVSDPHWISRHAALHSRREGLLVGGWIEAHAPSPVARAFAMLNQPHHRLAGNLQGMNLSLTRRTFEGVGPFREDLRELEDVEFSLRARRRGARLLFAPHIRITHHLRASLRAILKRLFHQGYWLVPVYKGGRLPAHWLLPGSLPASILLFLPLAGVHALLRVVVSFARYPAVVVCLPLAFLLCLSHAAGVVWYYLRGSGRARGG